MKCLANKLVGDMRTVEIAGVDVVHPARNRLAQDGDGRGAIFRRAKYARSGKLHRAIAHTVHCAVAQGKGAGGGNVGHVRSPKREWAAK